MEGQIYIGKDGQMIPRRKFKLLRGLFLWVGLQVAWGVACVLYTWNFHPHPFFIFMIVQYAGIFMLWYFQIYFAQLRGIDIIFHQNAFKKGDMIRLCQSDLIFLIFEKHYCEDGQVVCRGFPFLVSRKRWRTMGKSWYFRILIRLKLIK